VNAVQRYDFGELGEPQRLDNGYLKTSGRITRTGVFNYIGVDGAIRRELRLPEEVFKADSLESFGLMPMTNGHPPKNLTADDTHRYQVGTVNGPHQDGRFVAGDILLTKTDAIEAAEGGKRQLSCGYSCELEMTPGFHEDFGRYDAIQRNIRGNHVALVDSARGGRDLTIRLDRADGIMVDHEDQRETGSAVQTFIFDKEEFATAASVRKWLDDNDARADKLDDTDGSFRARQREQSEFIAAPNFRTIDISEGVKAVVGRTDRQDNQPGPRVPRRDSNMKTIKIDGVDYEVSEQAAQAIVKMQTRADGHGEAVTAIKAELETEKARADKATEDLEAEKKARTDEGSPEKIQARVDARVALQTIAATILGEKQDDGTEWKLDAMSDDAIQCAVIVKTSHADAAEVQAKLKDADPIYIKARFDQAVESFKPGEKKPGQRNDGLDRIRHASRITLPDQPRTDADGARLRMMKAQWEAGRLPLRTPAS
jgi:hypothetical protein